MSKKGVSLPISTIVILSIAVLVLIVLIGMFTSGASGFSKSQEIAKAYSQACTQLTEQGCNPESTKSIYLNGITEGDVGNSKGSGAASLFDYCVYRLNIEGKASDGNYYIYGSDKCGKGSECEKYIEKKCAEKCGCSYSN